MFKHVKNYFLSDLATKALGLFYIPIYSYFLELDDYGMISLFIAYSGIATILLTGNSHSAISRYFFEIQKDFKVFVTTSIFLSVILTLGLGAVGTVLLFYLQPNTTLPYWAFVLMIFTTLVSIVHSVFMQIHIPASNSKLIAKRTIYAGYGQFIINIAVVILCPQPKWIYLIYSHFGGALLFNLYFLKHVTSYVVYKIDVKHFRYILNYSIPLVPYVLGAIIIAQADRIMISDLSGIAETGLYSFAITIGLVVPTLTNSMNSAWIPSYFKFMNTKQYHLHDIECIRNIRYWTFIVCFIILAFFEPLKLIIDPSFQDALFLVPLVIAAYAFQYYTTVYGRNIGYSKRNVYLSLIYLFSGAVNILLNYYTIPRLGYKFAIVNTIISFFLLFILAWLISKYVIRLHTMRIVLFLPSFAITFCCCLLFYIYEFIDIGTYTYIGLKYMGILALIFVIYKDITSKEITKIRRYLSKAK